MSNPSQAQRIIKSHLQFFTCLTLSLSLPLLHFFFLDFSSKFVWHKNFEGIPDLLEGIPIFYKKVNK